jgi:hypothetical protein
MKISIETIPHNCQRYITAGDWQFTGDELLINVSETGNEDSNFLVALHEFVEAYLCKKAGVTEEQVDKWDKDHPDSIDPGALPGCPYQREHQFALHVEKEMAWFMGVKWLEHEGRIDKLFEEPKDNKV